MAKSPHPPTLPCRYGKYELLERIGRGGMAEVYRARVAGVAGFEKIVAIKRLHPHLHRHPEIEPLFVEEAKFAASIQHKNVVEVHALGQLDNGELYIQMEYVEGLDLKRLLSEADRAAARIPPWLSMHVAIEVLEGLAYIHELHDVYGRPRNVVHCDVSPENIFLSHNGEVKLGDFGVAVDDSRPRPAANPDNKGKAGYMSPEQISGIRPSAQSDLFSTAVVLWECLTQQRLFAGATQAETIARVCRAERIPPSRIVNDVPPAIDRILLEALDPSVEVRPASARIFQHRLRGVLQQLHPQISLAAVRNAIAAVRAQAATLGARAGAVTGDLPAVGGVEERSDPSRRRSASFTMTSYAIIRSTTPRTGAPKSGSAPAPVAESITTATSTPTAISTPTATSTPMATSIPMPGGPSAFETDDIVRAPSSEDPPIAAARSRRDTQDILRRRAAQHAPVVVDNGSEAKEIREPVWLRSGHEPILGPMTPFQAIVNLRRIIHRVREDEVEISADGLRFIGIPLFAELMGEPLLPHPSVLPGTAFAGWLDSLSVTALVGQLALLGARGKLVCARPIGQRYERREIHFDAGSITAVLSNAGLFTLPDIIVEMGLLAEDVLMDCLRTTISTREPLHEVAFRRAGVDISPAGTRLILRSLEELLTWDSGLFAFDHEAVPADSPERPVSVFGVLPTLIVRSKTTPELWRALEPRLRMPINFAPKAASIIQSIEWDVAQRACLSCFSNGMVLESSLERARSNVDEKSALVVAYILGELGFLDPVQVEVA